jgi:hypothetical protein
MKSKFTVDKDGSKRWYLNREFHRTDGPAIEYYEGLKEWWLHGVCMNERTWLSKVLFDNVKISLI